MSIIISVPSHCRRKARGWDLIRRLLQNPAPNTTALTNWSTLAGWTPMFVRSNAVLYDFFCMWARVASGQFMSEGVSDPFIHLFHSFYLCLSLFLFCKVSLVFLHSDGPCVLSFREIYLATLIFILLDLCDIDLGQTSKIFLLHRFWIFRLFFNTLW